MEFNQKIVWERIFDQPLPIGTRVIIKKKFGREGIFTIVNIVRLRDPPPTFVYTLSYPKNNGNTSYWTTKEFERILEKIDK